jgi:hypothetical protein
VIVSSPNNHREKLSTIRFTSNNGLLQPRLKDDSVVAPALTIRSAATLAVSPFKKDNVEKYEYVPSALEAEYNEEIKNDT